MGIKERFKYIFSDTRGLILLNISILALIVAFFGMLSGPLKEWGFGKAVEEFFNLDLQPQDREGRIIMLYHVIAITFTALLTYIITHIVKFRENQIRNIRTTITIGYLTVVIFGLGFAYWGHYWFFHGLFIAGLSLVFYAGVLLAIALWPWNKEYNIKGSKYAHTRKGTPIERIAFFVMSIAFLGSACFGAIAGSSFGNGFQTFLAENGVRHVHHSPLQLAIIGHLHIMLALIAIAVTLIIGYWLKWEGSTHKWGLILLIIGTIVLTMGVWAVVPYQLIAHKIIYVGSVFAMTGALLLVIFGWGKLIREGVSGIEKPGFFKRIKALVADPLRFGSLWQMVFMNFCVSGVGIFMAVRLEEIFRVIPFREERITLTGHWHILAVLTGTILLFFIMSEIFPLKGVSRKIFGWGIILSSDLAFAMITLFSLKRLWVTEENQQPLVDSYMIISEIGMGIMEILLGVFVLWLLISFLRKKIPGFTSEKN